MQIIPEAYNYNLPPERIAQRPVYPYDTAKLLCIRRAESEIVASTFRSIADFLNPNDLLVFNNTRVVKARLWGRLENPQGQGSGAEILLIEKSIEDDTWLVMGKPLKKFKVGRRIYFSEELSADIVSRESEYFVKLCFIYDTNSTLDEVLDNIGSMPIPPYIRNGKGDETDGEDYQTFFAKVSGSIAAPTASLHFTPELMKQIEDKGVKSTFLTLHVGTASFLALWKEGDKDITPPGNEKFYISSEVMSQVKDTKASGGRVVAVGTTAVRALESAFTLNNESDQWSSTELFIYPGYQFKAVDAIITNFHQPKTTHLLLVQAFLGYDLLDRSYHCALNNDFRFLSYGDGMLLV